MEVENLKRLVEEKRTEKVGEFAGSSTTTKAKVNAWVEALNWVLDLLEAKGQ